MIPIPVVIPISGSMPLWLGITLLAIFLIMSIFIFRKDVGSLCRKFLNKKKQNKEIESRMNYQKELMDKMNSINEELKGIDERLL